MPDIFFDNLRHLIVPVMEFREFPDKGGQASRVLFTKRKGLKELYLITEPYEDASPSHKLETLWVTARNVPRTLETFKRHHPSLSIPGVSMIVGGIWAWRATIQGGEHPSHSIEELKCRALNGGVKTLPISTDTFNLQTSE